MLLTYASVVVAIVFFRAGSAGAALTMLAGMAGLHGAAFALPLPQSWVSGLGPLGTFLAGHGMIAADHEAMKTVVLLVVMLAIVWLMPNSQQILGGFSPVLGNVKPAPRMLLWRPGIAWGILVALAFSWAVGALNNPAEFIYFQF